MGIDDNLLNKSKERGRDDIVNEPSSAPYASKGKVPGSLREAVQMEKIKRKQNEKKGVSVSKSNPVSKQTSSLLRSAWMNLISSLGLSLLWIDIHVFLSAILGKSMFCKLGKEWTDRPGAANQIQQNSNSKVLEIAEPMGVACCNLGCLIIVVGLIALVSMIVMLVADLGTLASIGLSNLYEVLKNVISDFFGST